LLLLLLFIAAGCCSAAAAADLRSLHSQRKSDVSMLRSVEGAHVADAVYVVMG
jgi:hypothetical protein